MSVIKAEERKLMLEKLKNLIDLKSIVTMIMVISMCIAFFLNKVTNEQFIPLVTMIITFYFAKKDSTTTDTTTTTESTCPFASSETATTDEEQG